MIKKITAVLLSVLILISAVGIISFAADEAEKPFEATGKLTHYEVKGGGHMAHENKAAEMAGVIEVFLNA